MPTSAITNGGCSSPIVRGPSWNSAMVLLLWDGATRGRHRPVARGQGHLEGGGGLAQAHRRARAPGQALEEMGHLGPIHVVALERLLLRRRPIAGAGLEEAHLPREVVPFQRPFRADHAASPRGRALEVVHVDASNGSAPEAQ